MMSGAEMVDRRIITDKETRDFARQTPGVFLLMPDEKVFGNHTVMTMRGGDAAMGTTSLPASGGISASSSVGGGRWPWRGGAAAAGGAGGSEGFGGVSGHGLAGGPVGGGAGAGGERLESYQATRAV